MLRSLTLENFRRFKRFEIEGLGRVNLLVGRNNCGKTSVLEAVQLLAARDQPSLVLDSLVRRGECLLRDGDSNHETDVSRLFRGHRLAPRETFRIRAENEGTAEWVEAEITTAAAQDDGPSTTNDHYETLILDIRWSNAGHLPIPLSPRGGALASQLQSLRPRSSTKPRPIWLIDPAALSASDVFSLLGKVVLTDKENVIIEALRIVDPSIERIAPAPAAARHYSKGMIFARRKDLEDRIPVASLGDGVWRMLGLALALTQATEGILLVDEIDTGFHHTIIADVWRLVCQTAARLDVQVFATTHSSDCWTGLASAAYAESEPFSEVSIHRLELDQAKAVTFSRKQMIIAAKRHIEVR